MSGWTLYFVQYLYLYICREVVRTNFECAIILNFTPLAEGRLFRTVTKP